MNEALKKNVELHWERFENMEYALELFSSLVIY